MSSEIWHRKSLNIKALTALVDRLSLNIGWGKCPERGLKTVSFNPELSIN